MPLPRSLSTLLLLGGLCLTPAAMAEAAAGEVDSAACRRLDSGPGPHSMLLAPAADALLISSHDRRDFARPGMIQRHEIASGRLSELPRRGEPAGLAFRPHHMALQQKDGEWRLWVINHDEPTPNGQKHSLLVYALQADGLSFRQRLSDPLLSSPNHLALSDDGDVYISNDRRNGASVLELALRQSRATLVHYREGRGFRVVADGLSFTNGVLAERQRVLAVTTFGNTLLDYPRRADGSLGKARVAFRAEHLDGLFPGPEPGSYFTITHGPLLAFMQHKANSKRRSASTLHVVNPDTGKSRVFFADDGARISAMASAVIAGRTLYIGQSFDAFILACPLRD